MTEPLINRRQGLGFAALLAGGATAGCATAATPAGQTGSDDPLAGYRGTPPADAELVTKIDFKDPKWNRDTYARMDMNIDPTKEKVGWFKGTVFGVRENEAVRPLFMVEGFSVTRSQRQPNGGWKRLLREVGFYRDIKTGEIMESWHNPYTNEDVRPVPIANDPFNYTISDFYPQPPTYGGLNAPQPAPRPFLMDWNEGPNGDLILHTDINLYYPAALQPDKWPRESSGVYNRVSELFIYHVKRSDVENPALTSLPIIGAWSRINPWLPWMLMGQASGGVNYFTSFATIPNGIAGLPADLVAAARALDPKWLTAPTEDIGPSLSSLENYARTEKPAPVAAGWTAPVPPPTPTSLPPRPGS